MAKIVHFEIPVDDAERASAFYREALGWQIAGFGDEPYWLVTAGAGDEPGADGALIARGDVGWSAYFVDPEGNTVGIFQADHDAASS